jgi:crotonobetainyl-CoA:carnitine CoA-transferase CaiB-like acyl-CoA transferase
VQILRRLLERADVLVDNYRPGTLARFGFPDDELEGWNPSLVHLAISGYGVTGRDAARPGYDFVTQAVSGLMSITGFPDDVGGSPTKVGVAISDIATGLFGAVSILASLLARERARAANVTASGGRRIDVSLLSSTLALLVNQAQNAFVTGRAPARRGNAHPNIVPYETFATADGDIAVAVGSERQWPRFCAAIGLPELATDPRFVTNGDRVDNRDALRPLIAERLASRSSAEWLRALDAADVPNGPINDILAAFDMPASREASMRVRVEHPRLGRVDQVGVPFTFGGESWPAPTPPPLLGEQADEILSELGYESTDCKRLRDAGVI